jgi:hypothetical protein
MRLETVHQCHLLISRCNRISLAANERTGLWNVNNGGMAEFLDRAAGFHT